MSTRNLIFDVLDGCGGKKLDNRLDLIRRWWRTIFSLLFFVVFAVVQKRHFSEEWSTTSHRMLGIAGGDGWIVNGSDHVLLLFVELFVERLVLPQQLSFLAFEDTVTNFKQIEENGPKKGCTICSKKFSGAGAPHETVFHHYKKIMQSSLHLILLKGVSLVTSYDHIR